MTANKLDISSVLNLVQGKTFEEVLALKDQGLYIKETDSLYLLSTDKNSQDLPADLQRQCNGLIFEKETNKLVAANQNKLIELATPNELTMVLQSQSKPLGPGLHSNNNTCRVEYCEDGTTIRLYNYNNEWKTATNRCIDAKDSFWSSYKTFDDMFMETFDSVLLDTLDKNYTYMFILLHKENRIVVRHKYNSLVYVSRVHNQSLQEDFSNVFYATDHKCIIRRPKLVSFVDFREFQNYFHPMSRGLLVKLYQHNTSSWDVYKLDFEEYDNLKRIRGNVPDIRERYLELINDQESLLLLEKTFPENRVMFFETRKALDKLVRGIHKKYIDSHVKHNIQVTEEDFHFRTLRQLHAQYKTTNEPIRLNDVAVKVTSLDKPVLKKLLGW